MTLRELPAVHRLLAEPRIAAYAPAVGRSGLKAAIDDTLAEVRGESARDGGSIPSLEVLVTRIESRLRSAGARESLVSVINATGVLLHTNLGRAPLAREALAAIAAVGGDYVNLEFDLESGTRGSRYDLVSGLLRELTGAEDGLIVNNCAAAILLVLDTFANGRECVVARNGLIEIGGGFRLPEILERSGATLVEVGTTNKVYLRDFEAALSARTAVLLRSHMSNYRIDGFVADVAPADVAALGRRAGIASVEDLGSGALVDLARFGLPRERTVPDAVADGFDLVAFSGDKLLGGPQAGIVVGRASLVARLRANPMLRALRVDKATLAALDATLRLYLRDDAPLGIPLYAMLAQSRDDLRVRAERIVGLLGAVDDKVTIVETEATVGGGALPRASIPSIGLAVETAATDAAAQTLRRNGPPIVGRIDEGKIVLDLRTVAPERDAVLARALTQSFG